MNSDLRLVRNKLKKVTKVNTNVDMSKNCTFGIGGKASILVEPLSVEELIKIMDIVGAYHVKYLVVGNSSNILYNSEGYDGVVIKMTRFNRLEFHGKTIVAHAGVNLTTLIKESVNRGLKGLEDGFLIPATVGGAVKMNASAFDFKTENCIESVLALVDGKIQLYTKDECKFGYRTNIFKEGDIILRVQFKLEKGVKKELKSRLEEIVELRKLKLNNTKSAGCVFKNPLGYSAGQLIEDAGLKGLTIGGAKISTKHANIIENINNATSEDVKALIKLVVDKIKELYNIDMEMEIKNY